MLIYTAAGSTIIGDLLINLRSVNVQDKALAIGYAIATIGLFSYLPMKFAYDSFLGFTCLHWGIEHQYCHLHDSNLAYYICFLTAGLILISALLKVLTWFLSGDLAIYDLIELEDDSAREMKDMTATQQEPLLQSQPLETEDSNENEGNGKLTRDIRF